MSTHTPGPWYFTGSSTDGLVHGGPDHIVIVPHGELPNKHANARLISAAPDLLAACKATEDRLTAWREAAEMAYRQSGSKDQKNIMENYGRCLCSLRNAISLAEGE